MNRKFSFPFYSSGFQFPYPVFTSSVKSGRNLLNRDFPFSAELFAFLHGFDGNLHIFFDTGTIKIPVLFQILNSGTAVFRNLRFLILVPGTAKKRIFCFSLFLLHPDGILCLLSFSLRAKLFFHHPALFLSLSFFLSFAGLFFLLRPLLFLFCPHLRFLTALLLLFLLLLLLLRTSARFLGFLLAYFFPARLFLLTFLKLCTGGFQSALFLLFLLAGAFCLSRFPSKLFRSTLFGLAL